MSAFLDSNVFYAHADVSANRHEAAQRGMNALLRGSRGHLYTSDYVYDEVVTLTLTRTDDHDLARSAGERIRGAGSYPDAIEILHVAPDIFETAVEIFERYDDQRLSFTDATTVALVRECDIDAVVSFDDDFDGLVDRTDPERLERNS